MFTAKSLLFYPDDIQITGLSDEIILPSAHFMELLETFHDETVLYVTLTNPHNQLRYLATIGLSHDHDLNTVYMPLWIMDQMQLIEGDNTIIVEKADVMDLPVATRIVIKPLEPFTGADLRSCVEEALMNLHSIQEGMTIPVCINESWIILVYLETVEPAALSRIVSGEVDVEFMEEEEVDLPKPIALTAEERKKQVRDAWSKRILS